MSEETLAPAPADANVAPAVLAPAPEMPVSAPVEAASAPAPVEAAPVVEPAQEAAPAEVSAEPAPAPAVDELTHLKTQLAEQQRLLQQATDAATNLRSYADSLEQRLAEAVKDGEDKAEQIALHLAAAGAPVLATLESVAPGPVHLVESEFEKIKDKVLEALHIHFGTPS